MNEVVKGIVERVKADKRTTWVAVIGVSIVGAGEGLSVAAFEPWGTIVTALGVVLLGGALVFTMFVKKPEEPPQL